MKEIRSWIDTALAQEGLHITGQIKKVHDRPWSTVLRVPTNGGDTYFKACPPALEYEAAVTQALYRWRPDCIPAVLAVDAGRGWLLMADGGETLRQSIQIPTLIKPLSPHPQSQIWFEDTEIRKFIFDPSG